MALLIPLFFILVVLAAAVFATDSRDGRDWSGPMLDQYGNRIGGRDLRCCG